MLRGKAARRSKTVLAASVVGIKLSTTSRRPCLLPKESQASTLEASMEVRELNELEVESVAGGSVCSLLPSPYSFICSVATTAAAAASALVASDSNRGRVTNISDIVAA